MKNLGRTCMAASILVLAASAPLAAEPIEIAVEGQLGYFRMAATDSANALFDSPSSLTFGGAVRATVWRGAFLSVGVRTFAKEGERVFVAGPDAPVQKLGHPLTLRQTLVLPALGYRFRHGELIVPYLSAGVAITTYRERSEVAGEPFDLDKTKAGFTAAAGLELGRGFLRVGAEVGYTTVPDTIGLAGVSKVYDETNGGGFHAIGKVVVAFGI